MNKKFRGIDISLYQRDIDYDRVIKDNDFVIIKAGQGRTAEYNFPFTDPLFEQHIKAFRSRISGKKFYIGVYWYFMGRTEAETLEEVKYLIQILKPYKENIDIGVALDVEDASLMGDVDGLSRRVNLFLNSIIGAGYKAYIYANEYFLATQFKNNLNFPLWLASIDDGTKSHKGLQKKYPNLKIWQYSFKGTEGGIYPVDCNEAVDIIGDTNTDYLVDMKDVVTLTRFLSGWNVKVNEVQSDINQDGYVNMKDLIELIRLMVEE